MTPYKAGDVVSVEFPFSDFQTSKRRPGLVLVSGEMDVLVICGGIVESIAGGECKSGGFQPAGDWRKV